MAKKKSALAVGSWVVVLACLLWTARSSAQITLDRYVPAPLAQDGFIISRPDRTGHMRFGAIAYLEYAKDPVVWESQAGSSNSKVYPLVSDQLVVHPNLSLGLFDRALVYAQFPLNVVVAGNDAARSATAVAYDKSGSFGEFKLGGRYLIYDQPHGPFAFGVQAGVGLPLARVFGSTGSFGAESNPTAFAQLLGEVRIGRARIDLNIGGRFRKAEQVANLQVNDEFTAALGMSYPLVGRAATRLEAFVEGFGSTLFSDAGARAGTPIETLGGLKLFTKDGLTGGLAGDFGLTAGYGSPNFRLIGMFGYSPAGKQEPVEESDSDADGLIDSIDKCPTEPDDDLTNPHRDGCPRRDVDGDGLLEPADKCPNEAEDKDDYEDADGCPDRDNDGDGFADAIDNCPLEAEDKDEFQDNDGCPEPDNDVDGVLDADDKCPAEMEDKDGYQDSDGCPDPDNDSDGVPDALDQCPLEPENRDGKDDEDGCPDLARLDVKKAQISTLAPIRFENNKATILPESASLLQQVGSVLQSHPEIAQISVEGHTDSKGASAANQLLSAARAGSVREFLIKYGIAPERLTASGFGASVPIADNATPYGRATNRRVEFKIVTAP